MSRRFDIWLNGTDGVRQLTIASLMAWRSLLPACVGFASALLETIKIALLVVAIVILPFVFWAAPIVAIFTAHRLLSDDEVRARMRADMHRNGRGGD